MSCAMIKVPMLIAGDVIQLHEFILERGELLQAFILKLIKISECHKHKDKPKESVQINAPDFSCRIRVR